MGTGTTTVTTAANFIPEVWSKKVIKAVEARLVMAGLVRRDFEGEINEAGDTVHVPLLSNLTAKTKTANTAITYENATEGKVDITIDQHKYASVIIEDIVKAQANVDLVNAYAGKIGYALAKVIDSALLALYATLTQSVNEPGTGETWDTVLLQAIRLLDEAGAPEEDRHLVIRPALKSALLALDKYVNVAYRPDQPVKTGLFGSIYGVNVWVTNQVPSSTSPTTYHNLLFQREAFALCTQMAPRLQAEKSVDYLGTKVVGDVLYGVGECVDAFAVDIQETIAAVS